MSNVDYACGEADVLEIFLKFGAATNYLIRNRESPNRHVGFGFVTFENDDDAERAYGFIKNERVGHRRMVVDYSNQYKTLKKMI